jgi:hypothetical protein
MDWTAGAILVNIIAFIHTILSVEVISEKRDLNGHVEEAELPVKQLGIDRAKEFKPVRERRLGGI